MILRSGLRSFRARPAKEIVGTEKAQSNLRETKESFRTGTSREAGGSGAQWIEENSLILRAWGKFGTDTEGTWELRKSSAQTR